MSLNKQQLEVVNQTNFPDNNTKYITPALLRGFNTDMIDSIQLTGSYATTGSNTFVGNQTITGNLNVSGVISASVLYVQTETASVIYSSGSNQFGDELTDIQTLSGSVKIQGQLLINGVPLSSGSTTIDTGSLVTTASFNAYTSSTNLRLNSLETNSASVNVSISNLNTTTASLNTSITNINSFTQSQAALNGTFATTGSNTFTGNQIIDRASKLYTNGIYWTDPTAGFNNLEIINQSGGNLDLASLNGGKIRVVSTSLVLTGSALSSSNDISTSANIYAANLTGSGVIPAGTISSSAQITGLGFVSSSVTASSLVTASVATNVITFTKGDGSQFSLSVAASGSVTPGTISGSAQITALGFVSSSVTASSIITASVNNDDITFTKGDGSQFTIQVATGSFAISASYAETASFALNGGVTQILAGPNIIVSPLSGQGQVTISSTGTGSGGFNTATGSYGSFYDTTTQINPVANTARSMSFNETAITNGVSISGSTNPFNTYIKTENAGVYNLQFSAQLDKTDSGTDSIDIWIRKNGIDLLDTGTTVTLTGNNDKSVAAWNWFVQSAANDYYQIIWSSADTDMRLLAEVSSSVHPGIPSVIATVNRVDQFLSNTGSFSGSFTGTFNGYNLTEFTTTASFNSYTSSTNSRLTNIETTTASLLIETQNLELFSASALISISNLNASSASQQISINSLSAATSSYVTETESGSFLITASFSGNTLTFTKGNNTTFGVVIPDVSGSTINTGSFVTTSSFNAYTQSNDDKVNSLISATGSYATTGSNTFTGTQNINNGEALIFRNAGPVDYGFIGLRNTSGSLDVVSVTGTNKKVDLQNLSLLVSGTFTASLQEGYAWVGGTGNISKLVATSSFGGGTLPSGLLSSSVTNFTDYSASVDSRINAITASGGIPAGTVSSSAQILAYNIFATTGSNNFVGDQEITGSFKVTYVGNTGNPIIEANSTQVRIFNPSVSPLQIGNQFGNIEITAGGGSPFQDLQVTAGILQSSSSAYQSQNFLQTTKIYGSLTASLQEGYAWVGGAGDVSKLVATSSFGGGSTPAGTISGSAQITALGFVSSSVTASSLVTASFSGNTLTFTKGDSSTFGVVIPDVSGSTINTGSFATTGSNTFTGVNTFEDGVIANLLQAQSAGVDGGNILIAPYIGGKVLLNKSTEVTGSLIVTQTFTASLQQGYAWVGDSTGKTVTVATSSFGGGGSIPAGTISSSAQITGLGFVSSSVTASSLVTASFSGNTLTFTKGDASTFGIVLPDVSGSTINTGSFATTGSNSFNGDQTITGSLIISSSANADLIITGAANIVNSTGLIQLTMLPNSFNVNSTKSLFPASGLIYAGTGSNASLTLGVYDDPNFNTDIELKMKVDSNGLSFSDYDNVSAGDYIPFMSVAPNLGNNPAPVMTRGLQVTGSTQIQNFTASLQQGYAWVGDSNNKTTLVATSSFGGGSTPAGTVSSSAQILNYGIFATTGSNTFNGNQLVKNGTIQAANYDEPNSYIGGPVVFQAVSTSSVAYNQFVNAGNYDTLNIETNLSDGTIFQDYGGGASNNTWMKIPANTGGNPSPVMTRGLVVTGSVNITGQYLINGVAISTNTGSFATTGSNSFNGNQTITGSLTISGSTTFVNNSGNSNIFLGPSALTSNTTGIGNVGIGQSALQSNTTGNNNFAFGTNALTSNTTGNGNFVAGADAGRYASGSSNIFIGGGSGQYITGSANTIIGGYTGTAGTILTNNIVLADGNGNARAQYSGSAWSLQGEIKLNVGGNNDSKPAGIGSVNTDGSGNGTFYNSLIIPTSVVLLTSQGSYRISVGTCSTGSVEINSSLGSSGVGFTYLIINPTT